MRSKTLAFASAVSAVLLASPASAALTEFRLPGGERPQQAPPPDVQGPVAPDVPASRRVRAAPPPAPTASRDETTGPPPAAPPIEVPTGLQAAAAPNASTRAAAPVREPVATDAADDAEASVPPAPPRGGASRPIDARPASSPAVTATTATQPAESGWSWLWLLALPVVLGPLGFVLWAGRNRARRPVVAVAAPPIERPRMTPSPAPAPPSVPSEPLQLSLEPLRLALTLMNATLAYRLELTNRGPAEVTGLTISADMISAHASISREEQLSGPQAGSGNNGAPLQRIERLAPGERRVIAGEFRLPFPKIVPIRQGGAALLVPLARFRVEAEGCEPLVRTFAIGQPGQGDSLQPFRLDQGPRIYPRLTQHAFA